MESRQDPNRGLFSSENPLFQKPQRFSLSRLEIFFGGIILLGLIYVGYLLFFQESGASPGLEKRVKALEDLVRTQAEKTDQEFKALQTHLGRMEARLQALESSAKAAPSTPSVVTSPVAPQVTKTEPPSGQRKPILHKVKKGETVKTIANKYRVSVKDLTIWNKKIRTQPIRPGDTLTIYSR